MLQQDYIDVEETNSGFLFSINQKGTALCDAMESSYAADYTEAASKASDYVRGHELDDLLSSINRKALNFPKEGKT